MDINYEVTGDFRELLEAGDGSTIKSISPTGYSLAALAELALIHNQYPAIRETIAYWASRCLVLNQALVTLNSATPPSRENMWNTRWLEFYPIANRNWNASHDYHPFESRFVKAAKEAGFGKTSEALAGAMFEMADNVVQHGAEGSRSVSPGLLGYHVINGRVCFVISDGGQGALASLKTNPRWATLKNSQDALIAIVEKHASSREHGGEGEGFKEVFRSLANLNGMIELRSLDGNVKIIGDSNGRCAESRFIGSLSGFQVRVSCALSAERNEYIFPIDYLT